MGLLADTKRQPATVIAAPGDDTEAVYEVRKIRTATLLASGSTVSEIAEALRVPYAVARKLAHDPDVLAEIKDVFALRRNAAARTLSLGSFEAVTYLREVLGDRGETTRLRLKAAIELLDRGGMPRGLKLDIRNETTETNIVIDNLAALSEAEIEAAARLALERRATPVVVNP